MSWHGYIGIENLALNGSQKTQLINALRALGNQGGSNPFVITQYRARLDNNAAIIEAAYADGDLDVATVKQYLANVFEIDPALISHTAQNTQYGPLLTLTYLAIDRMRLISFGGVNSSWQESRDVAQAYIDANAAVWEIGLS